MERSGTSESRSLAFAPGFVTSARLPVDQVKAIVLPVGRLGSTNSRARTPYSRYRSRRSFAFASDPTAPMNVVEAPRLDIWSAKFVAFPPGNGSNRGPSACTSPGAKSSIGGVTKSTIPSPIATTRARPEATPTPAEDLDPVRERLRDATRVVRRVPALLGLGAGETGHDLLRGRLVVRHDPRGVHPRHELLAHLLVLAGRDDGAHRIRGRVLGLCFD